MHNALRQLRMTHINYESAVEIRLQAVVMCRESGASWAAIGEQLGVSKAAAHKHFAHLIDERLAQIDDVPVAWVPAPEPPTSRDRRTGSSLPRQVDGHA